MRYYYQLELRSDTREDLPWLWGTAGRRNGKGRGQGPSSPENALLRVGLTLASRSLTAFLSPAGTRGQALRLGALRLLLFKLLLFDVLLTYSRLRALPSTLGDPGLPAPPRGPLEPRRLPQPPPAAEPSAPATWIRRSAGGTAGPGLTLSLQPRLLGWESRSPVWEEGTLPTHRAWAWCS